MCLKYVMGGVHMHMRTSTAHPFLSLSRERLGEIREICCMDVDPLAMRFRKPWLGTATRVHPFPYFGNGLADCGEIWCG